MKNVYVFTARTKQEKKKEGKKILQSFYIKRPKL